MNRAHSRFSIAGLLAEVVLIVLIVLGVFLGLFVNELRIDERDRQRTQRALTQIGAELASNADPGARKGMVLALAMLANDICIHEEDLLAAYAEAVEHLDASR